MTLITLSPRQRATLREMVNEGARRAAKGLEEMTGRPITATVRSVSLVPLSRIVSVNGHEDEPVTAVYLGFFDDLDGHLVLLISNTAALGLADLLLGEPAGTTITIGEMEQSALQEAGNVAGSFFLTALADATGMTIKPTPPTLVQDMTGAILDGPVLMLAMEADEALLIETEFRQDERQIEGHLLVLPDQPSLTKLLGRLG